jgi:hypothetical protein
MHIGAKQLVASDVFSCPLHLAKGIVVAGSQNKLLSLWCRGTQLQTWGMLHTICNSTLKVYNLAIWTCNLAILGMKLNNNGYAT